MNIGRMGHRLVAVNAFTYYALCGFCFGNFSPTCERYSTKEGEWEVAPPLQWEELKQVKDLRLCPVLVNDCLPFALANRYLY